MVLLDDIRRFNVDSSNVEDLVSLLAFAKLVQAEFDSLEVDVPEWLPIKIKAIRREVVAKSNDLLEKKLADAKLKLESLKTPQEKKAALQAEVRKLEKAINAGA